jgi:ubiquinone/menaquinone biosynthesis C-methylase UbiE
MSLKGKHLGTYQSKKEQRKESAPQTPGRTITWAWLYDRVVQLILLGREQAMRQMTVDLAQLQPGETVLDVGCGTGTVTLLAKAQVGETGKVHGIDAAPQMIAVARHKAAQRGLAIDFQVGLIEQLAFPDHSFDVVLSSMMMHHLPDDVKRQGLAEIARVLNPGGRLLILDFKRPRAQGKQSWASGQMQRAMHSGIQSLPVLLLHSDRLKSGIQDLPALMKEVGFSQIESGDTKFHPLGFALGRKD